MKNIGVKFLIVFLIWTTCSQHVFAQEKFSAKVYHRASTFRLMPNKVGEIIFLGNSITEQGTWREMFQNDKIINRGIGGDTTDGILFRLAEVTASFPAKVFLLIGANDLRDGKSPEYIIQNIHLIVNQLKKESPLTKIYVQSILPTYEQSERKISDIQKINSGLAQICTKEDVVYIDLFNQFTDETGNLDKKYSRDGLHLNGNGYLKWKDFIDKFVQPKKRTAETILKHLHDFNDPYVLVISHRGDWRNAPENSVQAIKNCIKMGVDVVEVDLAMTKDSAIILIHDKTLDRTTTGTGNVKDYNIEELGELRLKNGVGFITSHKIATLEEALMVAKNKILLDLDFKAEVPFEIVYEVLKKTGTQNQVILRSYRNYSDARSYYGQYLDSLLYFPNISGKTKNLSGFVSKFEDEIDPIAYVPKFLVDDSYIAQYIDTLISKNNKVWIHAITASRSGGHNDDRAVSDLEVSYGWLVKRGIKLIQTDRPALLLEYLREEGFHD